MVQNKAVMLSTFFLQLWHQPQCQVLLERENQLQQQPVNQKQIHQPFWSQSQLQYQLHCDMCL